MSSYDSIDQALNVENTTETSIVGVGDKKSRDLVVSDKTNDIEKDYAYTRGQLYSLIEKGQETLDGIMEVAGEGGSPRAYEVAGQIIKSVADTTDKLLDLQKKVKDLDEDSPKGPNTVTNNAVGTLTTDNDGSFDMAASNNFKCTPSGNFTLTFTNIVSQSGYILLVNSGGHTVSAHANTKVDANLLATVTAAGTYLISYFSDGTNVYLTNSAIYT